MFNLLAVASTVPVWVEKSFPVIRIILLSLIVLASALIIIAIMLMESNPEGGANVISGTNESFYQQNQASTREGKLKKFVTIMAIAILVLVVLYFASCMIYNGAL